MAADAGERGGELPGRETSVSRPPPPLDDRLEAQGVDALAADFGIPQRNLTTAVRRAIATLSGALDMMREDLSRSRRRVAELEEMADSDTLAPIANRRAFLREFSRILSYSSRHRIPVVLVFLDVNGFKKINDEYGHAAGDAVLVRLADTLTFNVRTSDLIGRLGGDEFGVVLVNTPAEQAEAKAAQLAAAVAATNIKWKDRTLRVSVAYGVHICRPGTTAGMALATADAAMYKNKRRRGRPSLRR